MTSQYLTPSKKEIITSLAVCLFPILILAYGKGHNVAGILLVLPALFLIWPVKKAQISKDFKLLALCFFIYFLIFPLSSLVHGGSMSVTDRPSRFLLALFILLMLIKYPPRIHFIIAGFSIGSFIAGIGAIIQVYHLNLERAFMPIDGMKNAWLKGYMPIQDGDIAMTLGSITLFFAFYLLKQRKTTPFILVLLASSFGFIASILSGSRGAWIVAPIILCGLAWNYSAIFKSKKIAISLVMLLTVTTFGLSQSTVVQKRIGQAFTDIAKLEQGNMNSSLGKRIVLWDSALTSTAEAPIFGLGYEGRVESRKAQVARGEMAQQSDYWLQVHAHNEYLEALSVFGVIGFVALMGIFLIPLYFHIKHESEDDAQRVLNQAGIVNIIATMGYGMTQVFLGHNSGAIFYPVMVAIFLGASGAIQLNKQNNSIL